MATLTLNPALGRTTTAVLMTPQTETGGLLADTTPTVAFAAFWKNIKITSETDQEDCSASDQPRKNFINLVSGTTVNVDVYLPDATVALSDFIGMAYGTASVFKWVTKIGTTGHTFIGYGRISRAEWSSNGKGSWNGSLTFTMIDFGSANPLIS